MLDQPSLQELVPDVQNGLAFQYAGWACHKLQIFSLVSCRKVSLVERQFCHLTATLCQWLSSSFKADSPPCHLQIAGGWIWAHLCHGLGTSLPDIIELRQGRWVRVWWSQLTVPSVLWVLLVLIPYVASPMLPRLCLRSSFLPAHPNCFDIHFRSVLSCTVFPLSSLRYISTLNPGPQFQN